jgi:hypothetical protein
VYFLLAFPVPRPSISPTRLRPRIHNALPIFPGQPNIGGNRFRDRWIFLLTIYSTSNTSSSRQQLALTKASSLSLALPLIHHHLLPSKPPYTRLRISTDISRSHWSLVAVVVLEQLPPGPPSARSCTRYTPISYAPNIYFSPPRSNSSLWGSCQVVIIPH